MIDVEPMQAHSCEPCRERRLIDVPAKHQVDGTWMCDFCFKGKSMKPEHTEIDEGKVLELVKSGLNDVEVANKVGIKPYRVATIRRVAGIKLPHTGGKRKRRAPRPAPIPTDKDSRLVDIVEYIWKGMGLEQKIDLILKFVEENL